MLLLTREKDKLAKTLGGIRDMAKVPVAVWIVDTKKEHIAVGEARKLGIPVVSILDTNCDPDEVDYPIPGNDDAIRSAALLTKVIARAAADGLLARSARAVPPARTSRGRCGADEPLAEWERELLAGRRRVRGASLSDAGSPGGVRPTPASTAAAGQHQQRHHRRSRELTPRPSGAAPRWPSGPGRQSGAAIAYLRTDEETADHGELHRR